MKVRRQLTIIFFLLFLVVVLVGSSLGPGSWIVKSSFAQKAKKAAQLTKPIAPADKKDASAQPIAGGSSTASRKPLTPPPPADEMDLTERSPAAYDASWDRDYPQDQRSKLLPFPDLRPGDIPPVKLYLYGGPGRTSYASLDDVANFKEFYERLSDQKPAVMKRWLE